MVNHDSLARPYARALFAEAVDSDTIGAWQQRLASLAGAVEDPSVQMVLQSKVIARQVKRTAVRVALDKDTALQNLADLLVANDRLLLVKKIENQFNEMVRELEAKQKLTISTPYPLAPEELQTLTERMKQRLGSQVEIETLLDPSLVAGVRIRAKGWTIEGNMQAQLTRLARRLAA